MRKVKNGIRIGFMLFSTIFTALLAVFLIIYVLAQGIPELSFELLFTAPSYVLGRIGILPDILNTVYLIFASTLIILPLGVGAAIYLNEYARSPRLVHTIEYASETLSAIPSIIFGLAGMLFFIDVCGLKTSLLAGALTLVVMNLPAVMRSSQEALKTVPMSLRENAVSLGAGKWYVIHTVVLPSCANGIATGSLLAVGRMLGESAALLYTAGFAHTLHDFISGLGSSGATLSVALYVYAKEQGRFDIAFAIASILMFLTLAVNLSAALIQRRYERKVRQ